MFYVQNGPLNQKVYRPFNLHPEKWFEWYPEKSILFFQGGKSTWDFLGHGSHFFLIYLKKSSFFAICHPKKHQVLLPAWKKLSRFYRVPIKSLPRVQIKWMNIPNIKIFSCFVCHVWPKHFRFVFKYNHQNHTKIRSECSFRRNFNILWNYQ